VSRPRLLHCAASAEAGGEPTRAPAEAGALKKKEYGKSSPWQDRLPEFSQEDSLTPWGPVPESAEGAPTCGFMGRGGGI
jgi:hypothetical protein